MRVPLSWLRDFVDASLPPAELAELLTNAGLEVTAIDSYGVDGAELVWDPEQVRLGQLLEVRPHPDADRLVLATVDAGLDEAKVVVTGAPNLFPLRGEGDLRGRRLFGALLLAGGEYLDPYKNRRRTRLKPTKIRGVASDAMLCSPAELGLSEEHEGLILIEGEGVPDPSRYRPGTPLRDLLGEVVLEIDIIPNIARCASILGVAREVAALTGKPLKPLDTEVEMEGEPVAERVVISSENPELNPRFVAILIEGVEQRPAPFFMQHRLQLAGQRPINVVVDTSNYVMLEVGQPNHTYDYDFLRRRADEYDPSGPVHLITRLPHADERITTLDGAEHRLEPNNILVADPISNLGLGGVMGGLESEIEPDTENVLLEAASWIFTNIRQTARQLGLQTEAAFRFSRGVHPALAMLGARRAAELLRRYAGGTVAEGIVDHYPRPPAPVKVELDPAYVERLSGVELSGEEIAKLLRPLELEVTPRGERLLVTVPDHRLDIEGPHDLVEEICRMYGYERIPSTLIRDALPRQRGNPTLEREERMKDVLVGLGLQEVITYRLTTPEAEARVTVEEPEPVPYVRLANPSTQERVVLRHSLLASLLEVAASNSRYSSQIAIFEIGHVFPLGEGESLPRETPQLALLLSGPPEPDHFTASGDGDAGKSFDFFDIKGVVEELFAELKLTVEYEAAEHPSFRPGRTALVRLATAGGNDGGAGQIEVGVLGELHPLVVERSELRLEREQPVLAAIFELEPLLPRIEAAFAVESLPVFPAVREDLALVVEEATPAARVEAELERAAGTTLRSAELFDVYRGDSIPAGHKSLAYHLTFQATDRTLADRDTEKLRRRIVRQLEKRLGATLRE